MAGDLVIVKNGQIIDPKEQRNSGSRTIDNEFNDILDGLNGAEQKKEQAIREELQRNYRDWADHINLLKEQFGEVWELFGRIQGKVNGWFRGKGGNYDQWGFMGASGYGYNFGAGIHYLGNSSPIFEDGAKGGTKFLVVSYGCSFTERAGNGIGDERDVGRTSKLDDKLVGLENCNGRTLSDQLSGSKHMLEKLDGHQLQLVVYNSKFGRAAKSVGIGFLYDNNLKEVCQRLFVRLNQDEVVEMPQYLPAPKGK